jgi:hypothetical protein
MRISRLLWPWTRLSFWPSLLVAAAPLVVPSAAQALPPVPVPAPLASKVSSVGGGIPPIPDPALLSHLAEPFVLPVADSKAYLNLTSNIQNYLQCPEFSTQCSDDALVTNL